MIDNGASGHAFLAGGGELANLIQAFEWAQTPLGSIETWSPILRTSVSIALRSPVPIVMLWGEQGIMLYNDAYSGFAGTRHPQLLGSPVLQGWPEVADFNDHVMKVVFGRGETLAFRDQELSLHRSGRPDQAFMNLDYSPIIDESGAPVAVIAIVVETTAKVAAEAWLASERDRMRQMFEQAPGFMALLDGPEHVFDLTNAAYMQLIGHRNVIGLPVRKALPEIEGQGFFELLDGVYSTGQPFVGRGLTAYIQRSPGAAHEQRFLDLIYQPVRDPSGKVVGIFVEGADVTEGIVAREDLRASKEQFELFAEAMPNHVWTADVDGMLDWFNSQVFEYSGLSFAALDGAGWSIMVHPDDMAAAAERWSESLRTGKAYETEFRLRRHDGTYRWHLARAVGLPDAQGRVGSWIGTNTDIDDQKKISQQLLESEARLSLAIGAGQLAVWDYDIVAGRITSSLALNRLFGFPADANPSPADYRSRYAPGEAERLAQVGREAMLAGSSELEAEVRVLWPDATEKWLLIRAQLFDAGQRAIGVVIDTTERKLAEQELAQNELRFRLSQQAAGIASLELDIASGTVIGSDYFWEIWGLPKREQVHISVLENIVLPEFRNVRSTPQTREAGTAVSSVEYRIRRPDNGEVRWLSRHIEFVHDETGKPIKMFGIMQDITERREAQARQELLTHELEHRIKNILAMVSAIASQTLRNTDLETAAANFSERLAAVSTAHDIMAQTRWTSAGLSEVVGSAMSPFPKDQISISGPDVALMPKKALTLALAVNELGTNAMKYGAFSEDTGRVQIDWELRNSEQGYELVWTWREFGGPSVTAPARRGFGRFLVERVFAADFGGTVVVDYQASGVVCRLVAPMPELSQHGKVA